MSSVGVLSSDTSRFSPRQATSYWTSRGYGVRYPSPFFDVAQQFLPENVHQLHLWCRYYFLTNPIINVACQKMASYPVTPIVWESQDAELVKLYSDLENLLRLRQAQVEIGLDYYTYGNAFGSVFFQLEKYLVCQFCKERFRASKNRSYYKWRNGRFFLKCPHCKNEGFADQADSYPRNIHGARLVRWNPENIEIKYNEITGASRYYFRLPRAVLNDIRLGDPDSIETLPFQFLEAARAGRVLLFHPDNFFHLKRPTIAQKDQGWGTPLIFPLLKDAFYLQVMKKAQECVSPDTLIETSAGLRAAADVVIGDLVRSHDGTFRRVFDRWTRPIHVDEGECALRFTLACLPDYPSVFSPNHPVFVLRRGMAEPEFVEAGKVVSDDLIAYPIQKEPPAARPGSPLDIECANRHHMLRRGLVPVVSRGGMHADHTDKYGFVHGGYFFGRILSIEKDPCPEVINFSVEDTHTFCTYGMATHNSLLLEHVVPLRILFPGPTTGGNDGPFGAYNLVNWKQKVDVELSMWKRDHNYIPILPMNLGYQQIGGQAKALILHQEFRIHAEQMLAGAGIPVEFVYGGLQWCQDPNSRIFTNQGLLRVGDVCPTRPGFSRRETGLETVTHESTRPVEWAHRTVEKPVFHVRTSLGLDSRPSPDHRWRVLTPDLLQVWRRTADLVPGDKLMVRVGAGLWAQSAPPLSEYAAFARTACEGLKLQREDAVELPWQLTSELARILGYMVAEGNTTGDRAVTLGNTCQDLLGDLGDCIEDVFGYRPNLWDSTNDNRFGSLQQWVIGVGRRPAVLFLQALMGKDYAENKTVPEVIRCAPERLVCEFLRAYFEGDGGVTDVDRKQMVFCGSKSELLLKDIQLLLLNMGIVSSRYLNDADGMWALQIRGHHVDRFAEKIGFVSERKRATLADRSPTAETHVSDRLPYVKEALDAFRARHFNESAWARTASPDVPNQDFFTAAEAARVLDRSKHTIYLAVKGRKLFAERDGTAMRIPRWALVQYLEEFGVWCRSKTPSRDAWGATKRKLRSADLSFVWEKEPELAERVEALIRDDVMWTEVVSVEDTGECIEMCDLTVRDHCSFVADGLVSHNSSSNTSLRALENEFLGYNIERFNFVRFIVDRVAEHMGWPKIPFRFERFRMADDLQRAMFFFQLNQAQKISDRRMLEEIGEDFDVENTRLAEEMQKQIAVQRKMQLATADTQGAGLVRTAFYQARAGEIAMRAQASAQADMQAEGLTAAPMPAAPGGAEAAGGQPAPQQGQPGAQEAAGAVPAQDPAQNPAQGTASTQQVPGMPEGATAYQENAEAPNASAAPTAMAGMQSQIQPGMGGFDLRYMAQRAAAYLKTVGAQQGEQAMYQELGKMQVENPQLYQLVVQLLNDTGSRTDPTNPLKAPITPRSGSQRDSARAVGG